MNTRVRPARRSDLRLTGLVGPPSHHFISGLIVQLPLVLCVMPVLFSLAHVRRGADAKEVP